MSDVVVIGAGIAGLTGALRLARAGRSVTLLSAGVGGLQLSQGTIDVLGYAPDRVTHPTDGVRALAAARPDHPYARLGADAVRDAVAWLAGELGPDQLVGDPDANLQLPTAVGAVRPTALAPPAVAAGNLRDGMQVAIVGFPRLKDFQPTLIADNLARTTLPDGGRVSARAVVVDMVARVGEADTSGLAFARAMDDPKFRATVAEAIDANVAADEAVGLPGVVGMRDGAAAWRDLTERLGRTVFEIPLPPPCIPGIRLNTALTEHARHAGVRFVVGGKVVAATADGDRLVSVTTDTAGRTRETRADWFLFAPGGFESGALAVDSYERVSEPALGLPLVGVPEGPPVDPDYWADHALFRAGVAVDGAMRPTGEDGTPVYANLVAAGGILAGATRWREKSGEGIAVASAVRGADTILGGR